VAKVLKAVSPFIAFGVVFLLLGPYPHNQRIVGAIFAAVVALWIGELIPIAATGLIGMCALIFIGGFKEKEVFAAFGDQIVPLFIGSFILAKAMEMSGVSDRFAYTILSQNWATKSASSLLLSLGWITCIISLLVSNTATTAMFLPIGLSLLKALHQHEKKGVATAFMLMLTWGSSVAFGFPVGTPPNLIGMAAIEKATGVQISFVQWMAFAMPITVIMVFVCWIVLKKMFIRVPIDTSEAVVTAKKGLSDLGKMTVREKHVLIAFGVAFFLWVVPDLGALVLGQGHAISKFLKDGVPASVAALIAAGLLFVLHHDGKPAISWKEAVQIDWGIILVFGAGIALGQAMFTSGLAENLGKAAANASGAHSLWAITALATVCGVLLSEIASNTAAATVLVPVAIGLAKGAEVSPIPPALGVALGASLGFMLPISTAPNAIVYSSGLVSGKEMIKAGIIIDVVGIIVTLGCLWAILPVLGLAK